MNKPKKSNLLIFKNRRSIIYFWRLFFNLCNVLLHVPSYLYSLIINEIT